MDILGLKSWKRLSSADVYSKHDRRSLVLDIIGRLLFVTALLAIAYALIFGQPGPARARALIASLIGGLSGLFAISLPTVDYRIRSTTVLIALFIAACLSEVDPKSLFDGRSTVFFALLIVMAPTITVPCAAICIWAVVQVITIVFSVATYMPYPVFTALILLLVAVIVCLFTNRLDKVVDRLDSEVMRTREELDEAKTAIDVVIDMERRSLQSARLSWRQRGQMAVSKD